MTRFYDCTMDPPITTVERAFQLAKSGHFDRIYTLKRQLTVEGYDEYQIAGDSLLKQLKSLIRAARSTGNGP